MIFYRNKKPPANSAGVKLVGDKAMQFIFSPKCRSNSYHKLEKDFIFPKPEQPIKAAFLLEAYNSLHQDAFSIPLEGFVKNSRRLFRHNHLTNLVK